MMGEKYKVCFIVSFIGNFSPRYFVTQNCEHVKTVNSARIKTIEEPFFPKLRVNTIFEIIPTVAAKIELFKMSLSLPIGSNVCKTIIWS